MEWGIHLLAALATAMVALPVLGTLLSPIYARSKSENWVTVGASDQFPDGETVKVVFKQVKRDGYMESEHPVTVYVSRQADRYTVFSATCTHLGCAVNWIGAEKKFQCPCHNGAFGPDGKVLYGPPPKPLPQLQARVNGDGQLEVLAI